MGKQRRRNAPTMQYRTFANEIRRYHVETLYILQHRHLTWPIRFCPKICHVGGRIISAPTAHRNYRSVIRWHRLRRGGAPRSESKYNDRRGRSHNNSTAISRPVISPNGEITSAQCADNAMSNICKRNSAAQPPLAPTLGELSSEARLRGRAQWQIWGKCGDCCRAPSQSRLSAVPALP